VCVELISKRRLCAVTILLMLDQVVATAWGVAHTHGGAAVAMAEEARHGVLAPFAEKHSHSHEDGEPGEQVPGHIHGHNPFDHSHETPSVVADFGVTSPILFDEWNPGMGFPARTGPPLLIERPPKQV